jgi:hypothetical protein
LQRSDLHVALPDGLIYHVHHGRRIVDLPGLFGNLLDTGGLTQSKGACHVGNIILAVILEEGVTDMPEERIAGTHQAFIEPKQTRGLAVTRVTFLAGSEAILAVLPGPVMPYRISEFRPFVLTIPGGVGLK